MLPESGVLNLGTKIGQASLSRRTKITSSYKLIEHEMDKHRHNSKMKRQAEPGADVQSIIYLNNVLKNSHFVPNLF